jgi:hypothetical protein
MNITDILIFIGILIVSLVFYWRGFISGVHYRRREDMNSMMHGQPINVEISKYGEIFYARLLSDGTFIAQDLVLKTLIENVVKLFPDNTVVLSEAK